MDTIYCDDCSHEFRIKLRKKKHNFTIEENYFVCPKCKKKYTAFVTDLQCRKLIKEIEKAREKKRPVGLAFSRKEIDETEYKRQLDTIDRQINSKQSILKPRMDSLEKEYA